MIATDTEGTKGEPGYSSIQSFTKLGDIKPSPVTIVSIAASIVNPKILTIQSTNSETESTSQYELYENEELIKTSAVPVFNVEYTKRSG